MTRTARALTLALSVALAGCRALGPLGPLPGGALAGAVHAGAVSDWSFAADEATAQLETRPAAPYSVNVWWAAIGERVYVPTSMVRGARTPTDRAWVLHVMSNPAVRLRVAGRIYPRTAVRVENGEEYDAALAALRRKYDLAPPDPGDGRTIWIFRLD
jgi:hypothetical protein